MAEEERIPSLPEKDGTDTSQSKDTYTPEEPTSDISISLLDIQMPETPDSTKGQASDGDTSRLESPKTVKPVLGKIQAKKRLMAFANQFKALSKSQVKPNLSQHSTGALKTKDKTQDDININKSRKKTEEKILAIEEIRREESKSKMLLAEAMAAASMEDENHTGKNTSGLLESTRHTKEKNKHEGMSNDRKNRSLDRKYSERYRHRDKIDKDSSNQDVKDRNGSIERFTQKSQDREKHKKDKKKKNDKNKRDNSKTDTNRNKKEGKDKKENEKEKQETKERIETKNKKENVKEKRNDVSETEIEGKAKKEKDKWKEKVLLKSNSWAEVRKSGLTINDIIHLRKRDNSERSVKIRTTQDYTRYFEQMLMLSNHRIKRQALIADGLDGPKKYPPESIKLTKRAKGHQLLYCENPRISLLLGVSQLLQVVTPERREKIRDICEASLPRIDAEDTVQEKRNWYQQINTTKREKDTKWQMTIQLPKSKWDSEDEEMSSVNVTKEETEKPVNKLHVSVNQQDRCSITSSVADDDKIDNAEDVKENTSSEKTENIMTNDEASTSSLLQPAGNEKLASEYEQFMKMVCTTTDVSKEYSPKKNPVKSTSPHSYHEFNIESNLAEDNTNIEIPLNEKFEEKDKQATDGSIKSIECEESTLSTDCQIQANESNMPIKRTNENDASEDSKSIPSDWENVRIKVERLSDENTESREAKKKKKKKIISSSDSSSSTTSSDSEKEKKKKKRKRKVVSNSSSSDSESTDSSSSSSSDSSSSEERKKRKRKKKKVGKKRKKAKRIARIKKKRKKRMSTDSNSSDSDEHTKKKKKIKKKTVEAKSINNGDLSKIISKSPVIASPSDGTKILQSVTPARKIKEETASGDRKRSDQVISTTKTIADIHDNDRLKQKKKRKGSKTDESFLEQWEMDSAMTLQQKDDESSSQDTGELEKMDDLEKGKNRRKRKHSRDNVEQDKDKSSKVNEERIHEGKANSDEEIEAKKKKKRDKDIKNSTEFLANWERESERITQQIQNDAKYLKKLGKQKQEKWGETDFDTLNVPSLTQLEKEVHQKHLLADEWEVDSLEAVSDLITSKRKSNQGSSKKIEKEVRYDKTTDTYIAVEKESLREMKKKQERLCAIRIWEEEQEEGEREEMMLLKQKSKHKTDDWDIEEESLFRKTTEEMEVCKVNDIIAIEKEWTKTNEKKDIKEDASKLTNKPSKRVKKSRWDMGSQSEEKSEAKDIWEEEYAEWSKTNKCEQEFENTKKEELCPTDYSESSSKSDLMDFYHRKPQSRESLERTWTSEEMAIRPVQATKDVPMKHLIPAKTNEELASVKEHQTTDQFKQISESDVKFSEKTVELYSPSSPALSQKSQDVEVSNESSSCNSLLREKRKKEMLITIDELSSPMSGIPLQLTKLRDTKHASEKVENILNKVQLEDKDSVHNFDIKTADNLFDDISITEPCPKLHTSGRMDIFAEYGSEKSCDKQHAAGFNVGSATHTKDDEANEVKNALKLIPKQLLIRRTNEQAKPKRILEAPLQDPAEHAAALLTIQKKLLESHALKNDIKEYPNEAQADHFDQKCGSRDVAASNSRTDNSLDTTEFSVVSKSSVVAIRQSRSPASEKAVSVRSEQSENYDRESKNDDAKKYKTNRNPSDTNVPNVRSPVREQRKKSPGKKESEKRYSHDKDKKERKSDDAEKSERRDSRSSKADFADRRRSSPSGRGRRRRSRSPYVSWERQGSGSRSPGHSWSRSRSKSPKRKDEATTSTRDRDKKRERYDDERSSRSRTDERKERYTRSPPRFGYNEDNFKKHSIASSKSNRDDWGRRRHDNMDREHEKDTRSYDPMEILRERTVESEKYRDNRFHTEELDHTLWQYESSTILRDGNESMDSYTAGQDLPLEYDDRSYYREGSLDRNMIQSSPQSSKYRRRPNARRERQWEKDKDPSDLDRPGHRLRNRTPPRLRYSPVRQAPERFRRKSRSRSRSWSPLRSRTRSRSRSGSRSRSTSRTRPRMRSQSRSRSRSPFDIRSRDKSASMSRLRSPEHSFRMSELRSSRSPSPGRSRLNEMGRERTDDDENKKFNACGERGRRIETIVQSGIMPGTTILDSEMSINSSMDAAVANFQYPNEIEGGNEYYYTENNLTYPPCIDESSTSSPKRLSLDDRLELELGIKKQHSKDSIGVTSEYSSNFNPNVIAYPSPPPQQQQQQMMYRQQPTVVQVGNVLQVVPADFNGMPSARREVSVATATPPVRSGSSQVVRVGNVLQVVPTSLDWSSSSNGGGQSSSTADQSSGVLYSSAHSPSAPSVPISVPVPVPVPLPVPPALPAATNTLVPVATMSPATPLPLSLPVPVPVPVPIPPTTAATFPRNEVQPQKIVQPVYNYEAILETRRKEQEERKRLRELRRKEKERRRIERINRRALRLLEKNNTSRQTSGILLDHRKGAIVDPSVLKALKEGDEQAESSSANPVKEEEEVVTSIKEEDEDAAADEEDDDEDEIEAEVEDDEEEEEEAEDEDEDDDDDEKPLQMINQRIEIDEATAASDAIKDQAEIESRKEWPELPPPPLKGILVVPGFRRDAIPNGNLDDLSDDNIKGSDKDEEIDKNNECDKDVESDAKSGKSNLAKLAKRNKKSVQFADGVKPGEGTSPSGGEGDMPSPPPPKSVAFREGFGDLRRDKIYSSRKSRKQEKRARPPKTKKKVKVKIIKLKKPRITPLTAMMMDDSDEMDDRSPPPPPPGSPPPPHLWPSYLSIYNTTVRAVEQPQTTTTTLTSVQAPPPPTPLPLLIPPPPLNYTIQPCSKS